LNENQQTNDYKVLDVLILSLFVIFILSLSNSIFVNQIGYFGALLLILVKAFLTRKNQFSKTGLELAFALYMLAEIISLIFSNYQVQAFHYFTKRALLIPVVYTTIAVTTNLKRGKTFFILFIVGSLVTSIIYLIISVQYYLTNQYNLVQSGPSLFQHPITASEIISFVVLFLFAFIVNEKAGWKTKLLLYSGFAISFLMLIATYKRTGWMGVAFGLILILIIKRKWQILLPIFILGIILFLMDKNISQVNVYDFQGSNANKLYSFYTDGRAWNVTRADSFFIISDYENGLLFYKDSVLVEKVQTPAPVTAFLKIKENLFIAQLIDTRFLIFERKGEALKKINEILPPGYTKNFVLIDETLYTLDSDSGLTIYKSLTSISKPIRLPEIKDYRWIFIDSLNFYFIDDKSGISVFSRDGFKPGSLIAKDKVSDISRAYFFDGNLFVNTQDGIKMFALESNKIVLKYELSQIKHVHRFSNENEILAVLTSDGNIYKCKVVAKSKLEIITKAKLSPMPTNFVFSDNKLYCTYINRGRLLSFFDPYLPQNFTRLALWRGGWEIFKDYPLFGVGDIGIEKYYVKYKRPFDKEIHGHLHNNYIHFLATLGLFGFLALSYLFIMIIIKIFRIYKSSKGSPFIASYSLGALAAFVSILIAGLSEVNFWDQEIATLIYFTVGLNIALFIRSQEEAEKE
jgi:hypothetical protein